MTSRRGVRGLKRDAFLALIATGSNAAYQWIVLIALAKFLGVDAVGHYAFATAVFLPIFRLGSLGQREIAASNFKELFDVSEQFRMRLWTSLTSGACCLAILTLTQPNHWIMFSVWTGIRIVEAFFDFTAGVFQRHKSYGYFATSSLLRNLLSPLVTAGLLASTGNSILAFSIQLLLHLAIFIAFDFPRVHFHAKNLEVAQIERGQLLGEWASVPNLDQIKKGLVSSGALTIALFLAAVNTSVPRFIAKAMFDPAAVGLIGAMIQVSNTFIPLLTGISQAAMPRLGNAYAAANRAEYLRLALGLGLIAVSCALPLLAIAYSPYCSRFLELVLSTEFSQHRQLFQLAAIASAFSYANVVLGPAALSQGAYRAELYRSGLSFLILVIGGSLMGHVSGLKGILTAFIIAQALRAAWLVFTISRSKNFDSLAGR